MYVVIAVSLIALALTYLDSVGRLRGGMCYGFILAALLGSIHYDYGNDYMGYYEIYQEVEEFSFDLDTFLSGDAFKEPGWALLCYLFKPLGGFFTMVAFLNIFQNMLVYRTISSYVEQRWWLFSAFIYFCNSSLYLLSFSMMRQELVMCIFLGIWPWIEQRRYVLSFLALLFCCSLHLSAVMLLPFAFWGILPEKKGKIITAVLGGAYVLLWWQRDLLNSLLSMMMVSDRLASYEDIYGDSNEVVTYGLGFLLNMIPFLLALFYLAKDFGKRREQQLVALASVGFLVEVFAQVIPMITRMAMYFTIYGIIAIPKIYAVIQDLRVRYGLIFVFFFMTIWSYRGFFTSPVYGEYYATFHTIFSQLFADLFLNLQWI